ncbi:MAG: hypothetical protein ABSG17_16660 [Spirochaetia bacterium]
MDQQTTVLAQALKGRMDFEAELFRQLGLEMDRLRDSFQQKKWTSCLVIAQGIQASAQKIERADDARDEAFAALCGGLGFSTETAFSALLTRMPEEHRGLLEESWRNLRMAVVRLSTASNRMRYSAEALAGTLGRILEEIFPHRKGKIYSRRGRTTSVNDSLLVDRRL